MRSAGNEATRPGVSPIINVSELTGEKRHFDFWTSDIIRNFLAIDKNNARREDKDSKTSDNESLRFTENLVLKKFYCQIRLRGQKFFCRFDHLKTCRFVY